MPSEVTIEILSNQFKPSTVTITPGTRVVWINRDNKTHAVDPGTLMEPTSDFDGSPNLEPNDTFSVTFINAGTINYYCIIHQVNLKQGTIIVQP
ncbi:MAG: cupredoxin domain-containing protein [bacterium]